MSDSALSLTTNHEFDCFWAKLADSLWAMWEDQPLSTSPVQAAQESAIVNNGCRLEDCQYPDCNCFASK